MKRAFYTILYLFVAVFVTVFPLVCISAVEDMVKRAAKEFSEAGAGVEVAANLFRIDIIAMVILVGIAAITATMLFCSYMKSVDIKSKEKKIV